MPALLGAAGKGGPPVEQGSDGPLAVSLFGSAGAFGADTAAVAALSVKVVDRGAATVAFGTAAASAVAYSPAASGAPFALAETGVVVDGADLVLTKTSTVSGSGAARGQAWAAEASETGFLAIDIEGLRFAQGPLRFEASTSGTVWNAPPRPEGNTAMASADADAAGSDTFAETATDTLAVAGSLSTADAIATAAVGGSAPPVRDEFVVGGRKGERLATGGGGDWIFGGGGRDTILAGGGGNTAFGNDGDDRISAGSGDDWLFGGDGEDSIQLGGGRNIGYGGAGDDRVFGGSGDDAVSGGAGDDTVDAGAGDNSFLLGSEGRRGDGDDRFSAGTGADWYFVLGAFDEDVATGFDVGQGDRLVAYGGDWDTDQGLRALNGASVALQRSASDRGDLVIGFSTEGGRSTLKLDGFFRLNPDYDAAPKRGVFSDEQALPILRDLFVDGDTDASASARAGAFLIGDALALFA